MRSLLLFALLVSVAVAQEVVPLEALREAGTEKVKAMRATFDNELALALRIWAEVPAGDEPPALAKANSSITQWVSGFAGPLLQALCKQSNPLLRERMLQLLRSSGSRELLQPARELLKGPEPWARTVGISILGTVGAAEDGQRLATLLASVPEPSADEIARILEALACMKAAEASAAARARIAHPHATVRLAALQALATLHLSPREELPFFVRAVQDDADIVVRTGALRALCAYGENLDALKLLHEQVRGVDPALAAAALDSLEKCASKDTSKSHLMEALGGPGPLAFKERCAKLLAKLGDPRGARLLTKASRDTAAATPRDPDLQIAAGDQLKRLGALADAIDFYKKAVDLLKAGQKYRARVPWARALALQGRFEDSWDLLKPDYRNLTGFADDPDFADMRRNARWAPLFSQED